jgi:hypothetical protein
MAEITKMADQAGDQALDTVKRAYGIGVDAVSTVSDWVGERLPQIPEVPYADQLPTPRDLTKLVFDFTQDVVKLQRDYAFGLLDAIEPVTKKVMPSFAKARPAAARKAAA